MKKLFCLFTLSLIVCITAVRAQRYQEDVSTILKWDKMYAPPANPILFTGSSSIRKWDDLERTFSSYVVMNRGVGGTVTNDIIYYADKIIFPYHPRQIVLYVGENDLVEKGVTADTVFNRFKNLYKTIRNKLPDISIVYISIKPSPSRIQFLSTARQANSMIKDFIAKQRKIAYVDIFNLMLDRNGNPRKELFVEDMLHMNPDGYAIWQKAVRPHLIQK
ncbi:GDSL-type esterase/lipase family protein [Chitinophaga sp. S165]|uniref:GDSL-type esterase/lipase family protein n=1 Tax=Chitinophaga sp. S165 TaxID=2135462 RepID=UPI000D71323A|nr:GDSL-type esterase/lipase family protein [Chitinophaga sp. S165]PWV56776.1 lysophospholipase L1-like esterase [Chitinophaga sp. S165]